MGRVRDIRARVDQELARIEDSDRRRGAFVHLAGVSLAAGLLAEKRGVSAELAQIAGLLHDLAAYMTGSYEDHARKSAECAKTLLASLGLTTAEETERICTAISRHDDKERVDTPLDEVLKDADVMQHTMQDLTKAVKDKEKARYVALRREFGLPDQK